MLQDRETIVAVATPPGRGGVGMVRVSGPAALAIVAPLIRLRRPLAAGRARFAEVLDRATGEPLDEAVVTFFRAPHSYTGEDVVEIAAHGSPVLMEYLLRQCCMEGAHLAKAGEFTQRAFLAGRLDLTQAEAVADLIESSTLEQARVAARQLGGALSRQVQPLKDQLTLLIAEIEAGIDFAEDDIEPMPAAAVLTQLALMLPLLQDLERSFVRGRLLREGYRLALIGRPNAGKSSLFNRLLEHDRAIVTATPGTTRDVLSERLSMDGVPAELLDTAGLRTERTQADSAPPMTEAETLGIIRSREAMADADIVLLVLDATLPLHAEDLKVLRRVDNRMLLVVLNKIDLAASSPMAENSIASAGLENTPRTVFVSALTGAGIEELRQAILTHLQWKAPSENSVLVTNLRQHQTISETIKALGAAETAIRHEVPHEMVLLDLYNGLRAMDELTGATTSDDILHMIFGKFCIGK